MALTTSIDEAETALKAAIVARSVIPANALAGVKIDLGHPGSSLLNEHVWISGVADAEHGRETTGIGAEQHYERYDLRVNVWRSGQVNDYATLRTRAHAMAAEVEEALRADHTLGGVVWDAIVSRVARDEGPWGDTGRAMNIELTVTCRQFLS